MELNKIEQLLARYFEGTTSVAEEQELERYFTSNAVAPNLKQYEPLFTYFSNEKTVKANVKVPVPTRKSIKNWISIAASIVVVFGVGTFAYFNNQNKATDDLGTYDDPEVAFRATQKALGELSTHVNVGIESVQYINEYENAKSKVFPSY
jgi:predicted ribosomally synthesized peptide with SipW-like signal peptide